MAAVLSVMRQLHEMLAHLSEAQHRAPDAAAQAVLTAVVALVGRPPEELLALDVDELRASVGAELAAASARVRAAYDGPDLRRGRPRRAGPAPGVTCAGRTCAARC